MSELQLRWCCHKLATYACIRWHYTRNTGSDRRNYIGVWEDGRFIGCIVFSPGWNKRLGSGLGVRRNEVCELIRVALDSHVSHVTRIIAVALRMIKKRSPLLRVCYSYADTRQGHLGSIYQAGNWYYLGESKTCGVVVNGRLQHSRSVRTVYGTQSIAKLRKFVDPAAQRGEPVILYKYAMPFDKQLRMRLEVMKKPYPKSLPTASEVLMVTRSTHQC